MVRFTYNDNHSNSNLAVDIPLDGSSCPLFPGRIGIWNVSFCGGRRTDDSEKNPRSKDDNQQKC